MAQHYSNPSRAELAHSLPDLEVFYLSTAEIAQIKRDNGAVCADDDLNDDDLACYSGGKGWYYWFCFPGCLPDSEPVGPFATEADALADAQLDADGFCDHEIDDDDTDLS